MRWAISAAVLALCAAPAVCAAQSAPAAAPLAETSAQAAPAAPQTSFAVNAVVEGELKSFGPWEVGAATRAEGQLPATLWNNTDAVAAGALFDRVKGPFEAPAANRLVRAALLSPGSSPAGSDIASREAVRKRFAALGRFGAADEISTMIAASPAAIQDPNTAMFAAQADLSRGRNAEACRRAQAPANATEFFLRLRAFCFAAGGDGAGADLALDVVRSSGVNDPWLFSALPALASPEAKAKPVAKYDTSLNAAVSLAGGFKPAPTKALVGASLLAQGAIARSASAAPALRAEAAVAMLKANALDAGAARAALSTAPAVKGAPSTRFAGGLKPVAAAADSGAKAVAITSALNSALSYAEYVASARLLQDEIAKLPKDATTAGAGTAMARACLALGDAKGAAEWRNLVLQSANPPPEAIRSALDAALVAAGQGNSETAKVVLERRIGLASGLSLRRAARDIMVLQALGVTAPPPAAGFLNLNPPAPPTAKADAAALAKAVDASQRKAQGETAIYVAMALAPGADKVELDSVVTAIQALRAADLMEQARMVAVETMIAGGIM